MTGPPPATEADASDAESDLSESDVGSASVSCIHLNTFIYILSLCLLKSVATCVMPDY